MAVNLVRVILLSVLVYSALRFFLSLKQSLSAPEVPASFVRTAKHGTGGASEAAPEASASARADPVASGSTADPLSAAGESAGSNDADSGAVPQDEEEDEELAKSRYAVHLLNEALVAERDGKWKVAIDLCTAAAEAAQDNHPYRADIYSARAFAYLELKEYRKAISDATVAITSRGGVKEPIEPTAVEAASESNVDEEETPATVEAGKRTVSANDYITRAMAFEELRMTGSAIRDYKRALKIDPSLKTAKESIEYLERGPCKNKRVKSKEEEKTDESGDSISGANDDSDDDDDDDNVIVKPIEETKNDL